jgi:hypothetical protein
MICGRLLFTTWLGTWHGKTWWKAVCECGRTCEVIWRPGNTSSCGCQNEQANRQRDFRTQRTDGGWGLKNQKRLTLQDGREVTARQLAREVGVSWGVMLRRIRLWPMHRWLEPPHLKHPRHRRELIKKKNAERQTPRPQPWAAATMRQINSDGRAWRKTKPTSSA